MKIKSILAAVAMVVLSVSASANLVTNGDFSSGGTGWTLTGNTGLSSFPGYWSDGAVGSPAYLSQTIATVAGDTYNISFDAGVSAGFLAASLGGVSFVSATSSGSYSFSVVADSDNAVLTFANRNDPSYNSLDNVVVNGANNVPEPASLALFGMALAGLAVARRRQA